MKKTTVVFLITFLVLIVDQALKFWVKTHMRIGEDIPILGLSWAHIHFVENPGMAFGLSLGGSFGKLALTLFRIIMVIVFVVIIKKMITGKAPLGIIISLSLILAGALGNIVDSIFYGIIFSNSSYHSLAQFLPQNIETYGTILHGRVVDMFYFPLFRGNYPEWIPFLGGNRFLFFRPVFNVADSSITIGIFIMILFYRKVITGEESYMDTPVEVNEIISE